MGSVLAIRELNHVALHVRDLAASEHFYENVLELPRISRPDFDFPGAWFALGSQELHLILDSGDDRMGGTLHIALRVEDAAAAKERLVAKGVQVHGPYRRPDGPAQIFFSDPDGYAWEMTSWS